MVMAMDLVVCDLALDNLASFWRPSGNRS